MSVLLIVALLVELWLFSVLLFVLLWISSVELEFYYKLVSL